MRVHLLRTHTKGTHLKRRVNLLLPHLLLRAQLLGAFIVPGIWHQILVFLNLNLNRFLKNSPIFSVLVKNFGLFVTGRRLRVISVNMAINLIRFIILNTVTLLLRVLDLLHFTTTAGNTSFVIALAVVKDQEHVLLTLINMLNYTVLLL